MSVRGDLPRRLVRRADAGRANREAIARTQNRAEQRFLEGALASCAKGDGRRLAP